MSPKHLFSLVRKAVSAWVDDFAPSMGAAISYYTAFSLAPLLVIVIAIAGALFGREAVQGQIAAELSNLIGQQGAQLIQTVVSAASDTDKGLVAGLISGVVLLIGATSVFAELQSDLDRIWHVPPAQKPSGIWSVLRARIVSFGLILGLAFLLIVSLVISAATAALGSLDSGVLPGGELLVQGLNMLVSLAITTVLFAMIFKLMPSAHIAWRDVWIGAGVTAVLFEIGKFLIGLYLGKSSFAQTFAAAGSLVVLLAWVYYAACIFLLGAEFTKAYADEHGSHAAKRAMQGTETSAAAGIPAQVPGAPAIAREEKVKEREAAVPRPSPLGKRIQATKQALIQETLVLAALAVAKMFVAKRRKRVQKATFFAERRPRKHRRNLSLRA
jgi:membrane protein